MKSFRIAVFAAFVVIVLTAALGVWQLQRASEKAAAQALRDAAVTLPPVRIGDDLPAVPRLEGRRVELAGRFDSGGTMLLDNRTHAGVAGFHVLTPLRVEPGGRQVMVLRGWVARDVRDRTRAMPYRTPTDPVRVEGLVLEALPQPITLGREDDPSRSGVPTILQRFDLEAWRRASAPDAAPFIVRQTSTLDDGLLREWVQPGSGVDRHYGYAVQWFALSVLTAVMSWRAVARARRRDRDGTP